MPHVSIVVPAYNVASTLAETLAALMAQSYTDFEIVIVDDGSTDDTETVAGAFLGDPRVRLVQQSNRGLAGARNTGIDQARGALIAFCDADDTWAPEKLDAHVRHLAARPHVGVSYSGSTLIDENSAPMGRFQTPRLHGVAAHHIFKRNPIGNGSAPVLRREVFDAIAYRPPSEQARDWYFDETFRQSEDIECWLRIALTTAWCFEGVEGHLTNYRVNSGGLSANTDRQLASWEDMVAKLRPIDPVFFARHEPAARAYQYRYLARRAVSDLNGGAACELAHKALRQSARPIFEEPLKTLQTVIAAHVIKLAGPDRMRPFLQTGGSRA